jgi:putative two-component system response regulator
MAISFENKKILIVDDVSINRKILNAKLSKNYKIIQAENGHEAINIAFSENKPDLILLDVLMPGMSGYEVCKILKNNKETKDIPIIFLTTLDEKDEETMGLSLGAVDYIKKPIVNEILQARVRNHLELKEYRNNLEQIIERKTTELKEAQLGIVFRLATFTEYRDEDTGEHVKRISYYCEQVAKMFTEISAERAEMIKYASTLHDVGKVAIPDSILNKPGRLNKDEIDIIKTHTTIGWKMLHDDPSEILQLGASIALNHHERWDGNGYPNGLSKENIPLEGRIVAVCDVFDALTTARPYKNAWSVEKAIEEIIHQKEKIFDPKVVDVFVRILDDIVKIKNKFSDKI